MARYPRIEYPPGTAFSSWIVIREVERAQDKIRNRRLLCRCSACGEESIKYLSNLRQGKGCLCTVDWNAVRKAGRAKVIAARETASLVSERGRICLTCKAWKPWEEFSDDRRRSRGKSSNCMECSWWRSVKAVYGIGRDEWERLHEMQGGVCALCEEPEAERGRLSIDHDHSCCGDSKACKKCIRGLLCGNCNRMLGFVEVRKALILRFADYLERRPFASVPAGPADSVLEDVGTCLAEDAA